MDLTNFDQEVYKITGNGMFTESSHGKRGYRCRDLMDYCRKKGIDPDQLPPDELKQFEVKT